MLAEAIGSRVEFADFKGVITGEASGGFWEVKPDNGEKNAWKKEKCTVGKRAHHFDYFTALSPSPFGGSKDAEYRRSAELFVQIAKEKGAYYALALLYDSQYDRKDLKRMM